MLPIQVAAKYRNKKEENGKAGESLEKSRLFLLEKEDFSAEKRIF